MPLLRRLWCSEIARAIALAVVTLVVYSHSLGGGFLNYDDDWLIARNSVLDRAVGPAWRAIFTDFSRQTRLELGAEYLPLRDLSMWLDVQLFGRSAQAMRAVQLGLYVLAMLGFRAGFVRCFGRTRGEWLAWLFALHPVHAESVAWLAGRKDVLALAFMGLALWRHARADRDARYSVPALWLCACLSKSMSLGFVGPLLATDVYLRRRPDARLYALGGLLAGLAAAAHVYVGSVVHMLSGPLAESRLAAFWTMGRVWLHYVWLCFSPAALSVRHDVLLLHGFDAWAALGWGSLLALTWYAARSWQRGGRVLPAAWLWFVVPLGPVSQVLVPLQNLMADRYLWLSVAGPLLLLTHLDLGLGPRLRGWWPPALASLLLAMAGSTALRASLFRDSAALFADATDKTRRDPVAPYQLGKALETKADWPGAMRGFRISIDRSEPQDPALPRASNNLAKLLAAQGRLLEAKQVLEHALGYRPEHPKLRSNHTKVLESLANESKHRSPTNPDQDPTHAPK